MKKVIRYVDEDTLEIMEKVIDDGVEELSEDEVDNITALLEQAFGCEPDEFTKKYDAMKKAEQEFEELYAPFKANLIDFLSFVFI